MPTDKAHRNATKAIRNADNGRPWPVVPLRDLASKIGSGSTPRGGEAVYVQSGVPLIRSMNVHSDGLREDGLVFIDEFEARKLSNVTVQAEDVLLNITGASIGRVTTVPGKLAGARVNQHVCIIRPRAALLPKFLAYFLASPSEQSRVSKVQVGATRQALTKTIIENWQVPVPPLEEQKRVVAEIEKQFTRVDAGAASLKQARATLKRYRASVLKAACEGLLVPTEADLAQRDTRTFESGTQLLIRILKERRQSWQGHAKYREPSPAASTDHPLPEGWTWASPEQLSAAEAYSLAIGPFGSNLKVSDYTTAGVPLIFVRNIRSATFGPEKSVFVDAGKAAELKAHQVSGGDILITKMGAPPGDACLYPDEAPNAIITADCIKLRLSPWLPEERFFAHAINSEVVKPQILAITRGVAQMKISLQRFGNIALPLPPVAEQHRIVAEVERRLSVVDRQTHTLNLNLKRAGRLRQSILSRLYGSPANTVSGTAETTTNEWIPQFMRPRMPQHLAMNKRHIQTADALVALVKLHEDAITPENLCLASGCNEELEGFFDLLRECRDRHLLVVPSGRNVTIRSVEP